MRCFFLLLGFVGFIGCSDSSENNGNREQLKAIDGYQSIKFGMPFSDLLTIAPPQLFNPASLKSCLEDMPIKGCDLFPIEDTTVFQSKDGIPYALGASFNKFDKLTEIRLSFERKGGIDRTQCLDIYERTVDWLTKDYGSLVDHGEDDEKSGSFEYRKTPSGAAYRIWTSAEKNIIASGKIPLANEKEIYLISSMLNVDSEIYCDISMKFGTAV